MSKQIDWSKAPEWAKKHGLSGAFKSQVWFDDEKYTYVDGQQDGKEFFYADARTYAAKDFSQVSWRPSTPSWSGEGLPPVGVVCMANGYQVVIVAHHCNGIHAIYAESEYDWLLYYGEPNEFRPIRTPEQIAADEREAALIELIKDAGKSLATGSLEQAAKIYDAGWRKHPKP